ncbi:MAG TPA: hypothetical protein G4N92_03645 [Anaerolineae bacterium]|nr:hypothetical protein [Anaerolineae bacterium]
MPKSTIKKVKHLLFSVLIGAVIGVILVYIEPGEQPLIGWAGSAFLASLCIFLLIRVWMGLGKSRKVSFLILIAFILRLSLGIFLFIGLPIWGYDEAPPNAGYLYLDAYRRDSDAWQLASSGEPLWTAFRDEFYTDQYGGLLSISAAIYRYLSPDTHRPLIILILSAFVATLGIPFFWKAIKLRWNEKTADIAAWILVLYPESVFLGSSQMREPFLIGLSGIALWAVLHWKKRRKQALLPLVGSLLGIAIFSSRIAAAVFTLIAVWFWLENIYPDLRKTQKTLGWILLVLVTIFTLLISLNWLVGTARWDLYLVESSSGRIQFELENIGEKWRIPFIVGYGLFQPVLPAAIAYPGIPLMRTIATFRSIGWYMLAPLIIFSLLAVWKIRPKKERIVLTWFIIFALLWVLLSSIRAGGDQWDNPRYRTILLPWMALLASWAWFHYKIEHSRWLKRIFAIEAFFVLFFLQWYLSRYYKLWARLPFWQMVAIIVTVNLLMILGGCVVDLIRLKRGNKS